MIFTIRGADITDRAALMDCDLKSFYFHWEEENWKDLSKEYEIKVASTLGKVVGFVIFGYFGGHLIEVPKLCVKPDYQENGCGELLLQTVITAAYKKSVFELQTTQPESILDNRNSLRWMTERGWKSHNIIPNVFTSAWPHENGIRFTLTLPRDIA